MPTYPLPVPATHPIDTWPRSFDAPRNDPAKPGRRHGACDLYTPHGTPVLACEDGIVTVEGSSLTAPAPYAFVRYRSTAPWVYALETRLNDGKIIRYAECYFMPYIKQGYKVSEGEQIGWVVKMAGLTAPGNAMLHFELYSGTEKGPLTQNTSDRAPYYRRRDILNPDHYLSLCSLVSPAMPGVPLPSQIDALYRK